MNKASYQTIDEYIKAQPENIQTILEKIRDTIKKNAPHAEEVISYGMPAFKQKGILVYFAAFKDHIGFFPTASAVSQFKEQLSNYSTSKGTVRFMYKDVIPFDLIAKIVKFKVKENSDK